MKTRLGAICDNLPQAGCLIVLVAIPLFFHINSARTFEPDKVTLLRCATCVMVVAWAIALLEHSPNGRRRRFAARAGALGTWASHPLVALAVLLLFASVLSTALSISPRISWWGSYHRLQGTYTLLCYLILFGMVSTCLKSPAHINQLVTAAILTSVPVSVYAIVQKLGLDPFTWEREPIKRVGSTFGNAVFLGSYLVMVMPVTVSRMGRSVWMASGEKIAACRHSLSALLYLVVVAVQAFAVLFSQSRGPILGLSAALFVMGLVVALLLRRSAADRGRLRSGEALKAFGFVIAAAASAAFSGGMGGLVGLGLQRAHFSPGPQNVAIPMIIGLAGALVSFGAMYGFMVFTGRGQRWLWLSWTTNLALGLALLVILNSRVGPWDLRSPSIRKLPYAGRVAAAMDSENAAVRVRKLIWDSALRLVVSEKPLGIPHDAVSGEDTLHGVRPLIGYGPESMFNALASVYPPQLRYLEVPTHLADRCHNESLDWLVTNGMVGLLAYYALITALVCHCVNALGLGTPRSPKWAGMVYLTVGAVGGGVVAWFTGGRVVVLPLGVPFGLLAGLILQLTVLGVFGLESGTKSHETPRGCEVPEDEVEEFHPGETPKQPEDNCVCRDIRLLRLGLLGAIVAHFIEVQFSFSHTTTDVYLWAFAGMLVALDRMGKTSETEVADRDKNTMARTNGLITAIILGTLVFSFLTPSTELRPGDAPSMTLLAMAIVSLFAGLAVTLAAVRNIRGPKGAQRRRVPELFLASSVAYPALYLVAHRFQLARADGLAADGEYVRLANVAVFSLLLFFGYLTFVMALLALTLSQPVPGPIPIVRRRFVWAHVVLVASAFLFIWDKNINVIRAEIYLKGGNYYRDLEQWDQAISLHRMARCVYPDEDDYSLTLAQDYFLMGRDHRMDKKKCAKAWLESERIALEAQRLNPYNPDHTSNLGRLYVNIGQYLDRHRFQDALEYFEKSTVLAPTNVHYHNLWAQTHRLLENHDAAVARLRVSASIDDQFPTTWVLLGDVYAEMGQFGKALRAHTRALALSGPRKDGFAALADANLQQRLAIYGDAGQLAALTRTVIEHVSNDRQRQWRRAVDRYRRGKR